MLKRGDFVVEERMHNQIFHGKLSHMIQTAILLLVIESNEISLKYMPNNILEAITANDIIEHFITIENNMGTLFQTVRDDRNFERIAFSDPHQLNSFIMHHGKGLGFAALADYLTDTFCKSFVTFVKINNSGINKECTNTEVAEMANDLETRLFISIPLFTDHFLKKAKGKQNIVLQESGYAIIKKTYSPMNT